jgi:hypothetical protein
MKKILYLLTFILFINKISVAQINLAAGGGGSITGVAQSYNENRGAEIVVLSSTNITVQSITLSGFYCGNNGGTDSAYLGARIYNATTTALLASANDSVHNIFNSNVTIPISYTLISGNMYRVSVYAWGPHPPTGNSGLMYHPATLPYTEPTGMFQINHGYDGYGDTMPNTNNIYVPLITLNTIPTGVAQANEANAFSVYPNPTTENISITISKVMNNASLTIYNLLGEKIYTDNVSSQGNFRTELNIKEPAGIYFLEIKDNENRYVQKLIIQADK